MRRLLFSFLFLIHFLLLASCSSSQDRTFSRVNVDQYYRESGVLKYFLPNLPSWANVSRAYSCKRNGNIQFFNLQNINSSFNLDYFQIIQMQYLYNVKLNNKENIAGRKASPTAEEKLFFQSLDSIVAGNYLFKVPSFKRVNLILVDSYKEDFRGLVKLMNSRDMFEGRPVFYSQCLRRNQLINLLKKHSVPINGARFLSYEMMTPFDAKMNLTGIEEINFSKIFDKNQSIYLYTLGNKPQNMKGKFILKKK